MMGMLAACTGGGAGEDRAGGSSLGPVGDPVAEGVKYVIAAGTVARNQPLGVRADGSLAPVFNGWGRFAVGDFAGAPGCPLLIGGWVRGASSGFNSNQLWRLNGTTVTRLESAGEAWAPVYGRGCSLSVSIPVRARPLTLEVAWFQDARDGNPDPVVTRIDLRHLRSEIERRAASSLLGGVMVGARLPDGDFVASIAASRRTVVMRVDGEGRARWIYSRSGSNHYVWPAGPYLVVSKRDVLDVGTGERVARSEFEIMAVRPDGSQALGAEDRHTLVVLKGPLFTEVVRRIRSPRPFPMATWYEPWRLPGGKG